MPESQLNNSESLKDDGDRPWIQSIHVNKIRHLENIDICISDDAAPRHLMVTGPNGSGKTSLLLAMKKLLEKMSKDKHLFNLSHSYNLYNSQKKKLVATIQDDEIDINNAKLNVKDLEKKFWNGMGNWRLRYKIMPRFLL